MLNSFKMYKLTFSISITWKLTQTLNQIHVNNIEPPWQNPKYHGPELWVTQRLKPQQCAVGGGGVSLPLMIC